MVADTLIETATVASNVDVVSLVGSCTEGWDSLCLEAIDHTKWGIAAEILLLVVCFLALALLCDEYLVPAIECLCVRFKIREDVAGALFVALGSSAPEIIINAIASMKGQVDSVELGIGAVIGSGAIAFLLIPAICTLFSPTQPVEIKRRPLLRDVSFYFLSLILVIWFISDGEITLIEAGILCGLYAVYLLVVIFSSKIRLHFQLKNLASAEERQNLLLKRSVSFVDLVKQQKDEGDMRSKINAAHNQYGKTKDSAAFGPTKNPIGKLEKPLSVLEEGDEEEFIGGGGGGDNTYGSIRPQNIADLDRNLEPLQYQNIYASSQQDTPSQSNQGHQQMTTKFNPLLRVPSQESVISTANNNDPTVNITGMPTAPPPLKKRSSTPVTIIDDEDDDDESENNDSLCDNPISNLLYTLLTAPTQLIFEYTIPQAKPKNEYEHLYPISFAISFLYLAFFSMVISAIFSRWTVLSGLGGDFFGLIMVSAAAELPDMIQSIAASKAGYSSMAMACLSSQIANILVGFGLSWFVAIFVRKTTIKVPGFKKLIHSASLQLCNVIFFTIITLGFAVWYRSNKVHMVKFKAQMLLFMYGLSIVGFAVFAFLLK